MFNFLSNNSLKKYQKIIKQINYIYEDISRYNNEQLQIQTNTLKNQLRSQKITLNDILPEAFATIKLAIQRSIGLTLFDVQILGSIILHDGKIAEMKTGEGKTLVAILAAYLNCLDNQSVHIVTVNDYLAKRDSVLAQKILSYVNIEVGLITPDMNYFERKKQYACDITYITNSELGFDYLRDNMATNQKHIVHKEFNYVIIDEIDSIFIDEARTPLIISGNTEISKNRYLQAHEISQKLIPQINYEIDEKSKNIILNEKGIMLCEKILNITNLYNINNEWIKYIINALKAKEFFIKNKEYIVKNNEIIIVDEFTGRVMEGRRWSDGLHQAIEAKEQLKIQPENKTLASITYQNLFLLYKKISGMTGTAKTEENEFYKIYKLSVIEIPTNKLSIRKDLPDLVYKSEYYKWKAVANECFDMYKTGRPTLIGTTSIKKSEFLAELLNELQIPYNLLNARQENIAREAEIIAQAGQRYSITISTNMAGRGTDIILGGNPQTITKITIESFINNNYKPIIMINENYSFIYYNDKIKNLLYKIKDELNNNLSIINSVNNIDLAIWTKNSLHNIKNQILQEYTTICNAEKKEVIKLGGLYVIGTERHESRRIDNQLRGRAGRQGDPGNSRFFLSLQDNLFRVFGGKKIENLMQTLKIDDSIPIESIILTQSLNSAQKKVEAYFYDTRKQLFEYDEVINNQRQAIYAERKKILKSLFTRDSIIEYAENTIDEMLNVYQKQNNKEKKNTLKNILTLLNITTDINIHNLIEININEIKEFLYEQLRITYDLRENYLEQLRPGLIRKLEKYYLLQQIDQSWQEHLEKMVLLREYIGWRSYGQQDPLIEYKNEAFNLFINMIISIRQTVIYLIMRSRLIINT